MDNIKKRVTDFWFWAGILSAVLSATQIQPQDLTTWSIVGDKVLLVVSNPYKLSLVIVAVVCFWNNPTTRTRGFWDDSKRV